VDETIAESAVNDAFVNAVETIYRAAPDPANWPDALQAIADVFAGVGTVLLWRRDDGRLGTIVSPKLVAAQDEFQKTWWQHDIRTYRAIEQGYVRRQDAITDRHVVTEAEIAEHPIYREFLVPHGLGWFAGVAVSPDPRIDVVISVQRAMAEPPFSDAELGVLERIARHVENALRLGTRLLDAEVSRLGLSDALTRINIGVFALDALKRVVFQNPAAGAMLGDGLGTVADRLAATDAREQEALTSAIDGIIDGAPGDRGSAPRPILIRRRKSDRPVALYVLPVSPAGHEAAFLVHTRVIVLLIDPLVDAPADPALVRDLLDLTLGEARVAALVGFGMSPKAAAERLGIAEGTARVVLKRVFAKTGIARQNELSALLTRLSLR
jgi:DNA-binding CsgD family transcriptional regulator/PAS domain-containing protein